MNIGFLTTWNQICGVAEYTKQLVKALEERGHEISIFANYPHQELTEPDSKNVVRRFGTGFNEPEKRKVNVESVYILSVAGKLDAVHIQYQSYLWPDMSGLVSLLGRIRKQKIKTVVTFHDSCLGPDFPFHLFDILITHGSEFKQTNTRNFTVPMGIPEIEFKPLSKRVSVCSFGLGRNDNDFVRKVTSSIGVEYNILDPFKKWLPLEELMNEIQKSSAVVLFYPKTDAKVSSSAARVALGTYRPVVTSSANWFTDIKDYVVWADVENLESILKDVLYNEETKERLLKKTKEAIKKYGWRRVVEYYEKEIYKR